MLPPPQTLPLQLTPPGACARIWPVQAVTGAIAVAVVGEIQSRPRLRPGIQSAARFWLPALLQRRELLWLLVERDIKTRYKQSILGLYWAIVEPLAVAIVFTIVFSTIVRVPTGDTPYVVFLLSGLLPWTFFSNAINSAAASIVRNPSLITKVYFPREILPIGAVLARLVDFAISLAILLGVMLVYHVVPASTALLLPVILLLHMVFTMGIALLVSAANVFYRDVAQLLGIVLMLWMYLTPVFYPIDLVPTRYLALFQLNPMVAIVDAYRAALLGRAWPGAGQMAYSAGIAIVVLAFGYFAFKKYERLFADVV